MTAHTVWPPCLGILRDGCNMIQRGSCRNEGRWGGGWGRGDGCGAAEQAETVESTHAGWLARIGALGSAHLSLMMAATRQGHLARTMASGRGGGAKQQPDPTTFSVIRRATHLWQYML
jgi:hypothetical protein